MAQCMWCKDITELFERKGDKMGLLREMEMRWVILINKSIQIKNVIILFSILIIISSLSFDHKQQLN